MYVAVFSLMCGLMMIRLRIAPNKLNIEGPKHPAPLIKPQSAPNLIITSPTIPCTPGEAVKLLSTIEKENDLTVVGDNEIMEECFEKDEDDDEDDDEGEIEQQELGLLEDSDVISYTDDGNIILDLAIDDSSPSDKSTEYDSDSSLNCSPCRTPVSPFQRCLRETPTPSILSVSRFVGFHSQSADNDDASVLSGLSAMASKFVAFTANDNDTEGPGDADSRWRSVNQLVQFSDEIDTPSAPSFVPFDAKALESEREDLPFVSLATETEREDFCSFGDDEDDSSSVEEAELGCFEDERSALVIRRESNPVPIMLHRPKAYSYDIDSDWDSGYSAHSSRDADVEYDSTDEFTDESDSEHEGGDTHGYPRWSRRNTESLESPVRGRGSSGYPFTKRLVPLYTDESDNDTVSSLGDEGVEDLVPDFEHYNEDGNIILDFAVEDDGGDPPAVIDMVVENVETGDAHGYVTGSSDSEWEDYCDESSESDWASSESFESSHDSKTPFVAFGGSESRNQTIIGEHELCPVFKNDAILQECKFVSLNDDLSDTQHFVSFGDDEE